MKHHCLILALILTSLLACKKHNTVNSYFRFQVGNSHYTLDSTYATVDTSHGMAITVIYAQNKDHSIWSNFDLQSGSKQIAGAYIRNQQNNFIIEGGISIINGLYITPYVITSGPFIVTIHQSSNGYLSGSFSGTMINNGIPGDTTIHDGQFNIPYIYHTY